MARAAGGGERAVNPCVAREYIESCLKIRTKSGAVVPFRLNAAQQKLYAVAKHQQDEGKPVRIIILKARQLGFSTLTEALLFHACATRSNVNALVVAHREDATANLFRMSKLFYDELPAPVKPMLRTSNAQELVFENPSRASRGALPGLRSRFRCATAGGRGIGRSDTLQCVHLSEYAFWPEGGESKAATLAGILQAVPSRPGTMVIMESTANGCEDFKDRWDAAVAGENDFEPVFFAWFENPDYAMPVEPGIEWTAEERETRERYSLSWEQLRWRRWCIANNCGGSRDMFRQEYPANPDEAFLHSGSSSSAAARRPRRPCAAGGSSPAIKTARASGRMTTRARSAFTANASRAIRMCSAATPRARARTGSPRTSSTTAPANRRRASGGVFPSRSMSGRCTRSGGIITTRSSRSKRISQRIP